MSKPTLLIVEDDEGVATQMRWAFIDDYEVLQADNRAAALDVMRSASPSVVMLDLGLPPDPSGSSEGLRAIREMIEADPAVKILTITGRAEKANALKAIEYGAFDFFSKPLDLDEVKITVKRALHVSMLERENMELRRELDGSGLEGMVGMSPAMQDVFGHIRKVATVDISVLILGESGTGKELAARAIHNLSNRRNGPFCVINCGAIPENLLESELFGHEKGAFTGASSRRRGRIEYAHRGTLFLDEVGELPPPLQVKLLRFLQDFNIERVGGRESIAVDVRIVAATNRDIEAEVAAGNFRDDLYFRLGVVTLKLPPLRERGEDIYLLALSFLKKYASAFNKGIRGLSDSAIAALRSYEWPGNIRELENRMKRAAAMCRGPKITASDLALGGTADETAPGSVGLLAAREELDRRLIQESLLRHKGVVSRAAADLGISRQYLSDLLNKYNINPRAL